MGVKKNYSFIIFLRGGESAADPLEKNYFTLVNNSFDASLIAAIFNRECLINA